MQAIDNEFFDEYKKLDKICGEIFNCTNGVSEYIKFLPGMKIIGN